MLRSCISDGVAAYERDYRRVRHLHTKCARAAIINSHIIAAVRRSFIGSEGVRFLEPPNSFLLCIETSTRRFLIKFKKLNRYLLTSNNFTQQSIAFVEQRGSLQMELPGILKKEVNLVAGYCLHKFTGELQGIYLVCPHDRFSNKWVLPLLNKNAVKTTEIIEFPERRAVPEPKRRWKLKDLEISNKKLKNDDQS